jgi:hypothetical protein
MQRKMRLGLFTAIAVLIVLEGMRVVLASLDHVEVRLVQPPDVIEVVEESFVATPWAGKLDDIALVPRPVSSPTAQVGVPPGGEMVAQPSAIPENARPTATRTRAAEDSLRPTLMINPSLTPTTTPTLSNIPTRLPQGKPGKDGGQSAPESPTSVPPGEPEPLPTNAPPEAPMPTSAPIDPPTQAPPESHSPTPTSAPEAP